MQRALRELKKGYRKLFPAPIRLTASTAPNTKFQNFAKEGVLTLPAKPIFSRDDVFFAMGSCFAEEIRIALEAKQIACVPRYRNIRFDPDEVVLDGLPDHENMNFYNSFTMRLQFEQMFGLWTQEPGDHWTVRRAPTPWQGLSYQDPYRRLIMAKTPERLHETVSDVNREMLAGFNEATAFILTFGMTEVFINAKSGKVAGQQPLYKGGGGDTETTLHVSTFTENYANILAIIDLIRSKKPDAPIVLTVSPVGLLRTFQDQDVVTVNTESKAILRAAIGQACRERENVHYLPSFEFVSSLGYSKAYRGDRRHVQRPVVGQIIDAFFSGFMKP